MATSNLSTKCSTCKEERTTYPCPGCSKQFCLTDLTKHREELRLRFHEIEHQRNEFVQMINDQQKTIPNNHPAIIQINLWEQKSIEKIKQTAEKQRQLVQQSIHGYFPRIQTQFNDFTQQIQQINKRKDFNEKILQKLQSQLNEFRQQISQPNNIEIKQDPSSTFIQKLSIQILHSQHQTNLYHQHQTNLYHQYQTNLYHRHQLKSNIKWKPNAQTIAGGKEKGDKLNQLCGPHGIYVDHHLQHHIYIADYWNHRIVKRKLSQNNGEIVAGGNGQGNRIDQLFWPTDVIVDENNKSLIICDRGNRRVVRWSLQNPDDKQIPIENILGGGLMMNENGDLFVSDQKNHAVKRWRKGEIGSGGEGRIVAGGNGCGDKLNQLNSPSYIFIDREESVYVSDNGNHRVMKWLKGANESIVVAGGQGQGNSLNQLYDPKGLVVNEVGDIYVADSFNHRIMCWSLGSKEGRVVVGGNGAGQGSNQLNNPRGLSFDVENNLYVADWGIIEFNDLVLIKIKIDQLKTNIGNR